MFNLKIEKNDDAYYFTITRPDKSAMTGSRLNLSEVFQELEEHIAAWEINSCDCCWDA
jgi:hypothetical protein